MYKSRMHSNDFFSKVAPLLEKLLPFLPLFAKGSKISILPLLIPILLTLKKGGLGKFGTISLLYSLYEIFKILRKKR